MIQLVEMIYCDYVKKARREELIENIDEWAILVLRLIKLESAN